MAGNGTVDPDTLAAVALDDAQVAEPEAGAKDTAPRKAKAKAKPASSAAPRKRGRPAGSTAAAAASKRIQARAAALGELLVIPSIPAQLAGADFLAQHFAGTAGPTAQRLAELAEQSPPLARIIDSAGTGGLYIGLLFVALGYLGPVALYLTGHAEAAQQASMAVQLQGNPELLQQMAAAMTGAAQDSGGV